ncbi:MAG: phage head closure protein [Bacteroidales bacterium]|nr:phage head closure protein [Bacteroidales bacterium]MBD5235142.1 phage head closure protein [Barnesiella sp.]MBD5257387.1 phage head closure protein [Barnesiella sp.]
MNAGTLFYDIVIEKPEIIVNDDFGSQTETWVKHIKTKADIIWDSGSRTNDNNETFYAWNMTFRIRYYHDVNEKMRIVWNNKRYRILSIMPDRIKQVKTIRTELIND